MKDRVEVYTDKGDIVIRMPIDAAIELVRCFGDTRVHNPPVAKKLREAIVSLRQGWDYRGWVEKRNGEQNEEDQKAASETLQGRKASEEGKESPAGTEGDSQQGSKP